MKSNKEQKNMSSKKVTLLFQQYQECVQCLTTRYGLEVAEIDDHGDDFEDKGLPSQDSSEENDGDVKSTSISKNNKAGVPKSLLSTNIRAPVKRESRCNCEIIRRGELRNAKDHSKCLDALPHHGGNVESRSCDNSDSQKWCWCTDNTLRHEKNGFCLAAGYHFNSNVVTERCTVIEGEDWYDTRHRWNALTQKGVDLRKRPQTYFQLMSWQRNQCMDVSGYQGRGNVGTYTCEPWNGHGKDQFFYFNDKGDSVSGYLQNLSLIHI